MTKKTSKEILCDPMMVGIGFPLLGFVALFVFAPYLVPHLVPLDNPIKQIESWSVENPHEYAEIVTGKDVTVNSLADNTSADISSDKYGDYLVRYVPTESGDLTLCLESPSDTTQSVYYEGEQRVLTDTCSLTDS